MNLFIRQIDLNEFRIQLWPGYETSIKKHRYDLLLNCDVAHKVMRTDTVYDLLRSIRRNRPNDLLREFQGQIIGKTVLTAYNNRTYRIDDVDFERTPTSTFQNKDREITFAAYFAEVI